MPGDRCQFRCPNSHDDARTIQVDSICAHRGDAPRGWRSHPCLDRLFPDRSYQAARHDVPVVLDIRISGDFSDVALGQISSVDADLLYRLGAPMRCRASGPEALIDFDDRVSAKHGLDLCSYLGRVNCPMSTPAL